MKRALPLIRFVTALATGVWLLTSGVGGVRLSPAQDTSVARRDLANNDDYRVRVEAALILARKRTPESRLALEGALADPHPAVRVAAGAALKTLGDAAAIPALERHFNSEGSAAVKSQLRLSIDTLRNGAGGGGGGGTANANAKYIVALGNMKNLTNVRGEALSQVMRTATSRRASALSNAQFTETVPTGPGAKVPVLVLDGNLTRLAQQSQSNGSVTFSAQVEFSVRKVPEHTLRASLSGGATSVGSSRSLSDQAIISLQDQAVDGAVESAMRNADVGLAAAVKSGR